MDKFLHVTGCDCEAAHAEQSQHSAEEVTGNTPATNICPTCNGIGSENVGTKVHPHFLQCRNCESTGTDPDAKPVTDEEWDYTQEPPAGKTVLCTWSTRQPVPVIIDFISPNHSIFTIKSSSVQIHVMTKFCKFTPIKTEAQLAEEERKSNDLKALCTIIQGAVNEEISITKASKKIDAYCQHFARYMHSARRG